MSAVGLARAAEDYLALRRSFGYRLVGHDRLLADFVDCMERSGLDTVTVEAAITWATKPEVTPLRRSQRLSAVRGFALHLSALDPRCQVPPRAALPEGRRRVPPHIYTDEELAELVRCARRMVPSLRAATFETAIGLLVVTGMRAGEIVRLGLGDVDLEEGTVRVVASKFARSRELALHPSAVEALRRYRLRRDVAARPSGRVSFFMSSTGAPLSLSTLDKGFWQLVGEAGLAPPPGARHRRPRLTDIRHTFAVMTLLRWYREGRDVGSLLPVLSAQLGHVDPSSTYWYLTGVPELLAVASQRAAAAWEGRP